MISTARVPADKPVRIAFSLDNASDDTPPEDAIPLVFPELDQQLQPLAPCHDSVNPCRCSNNTANSRKNTMRSERKSLCLRKGKRSSSPSWIRQKGRRWMLLSWPGNSRS
ncbi:MAP3K7 C-terminal-like protein isoform X2 [Zalophus californianus]|nr:MAP3K7 C-terminal-like protein isoform X2 [Zalophus californianus]